MFRPFVSNLSCIPGTYRAAEDWRWGLRVTPIMGALAVFLIIFLMTDPERGAADGSRLKPTSPVSDVKALLRNKSYVFSTIGFTCVCYAAGTCRRSCLKMF